MGEPGPASGRTLAPELVLLVGVAAVSTGSIFARLAEAHPLVVALGRCAVAALVLAAFSGRGLAGALRAARPDERRRLFAAGFFLAVHFATWIASLDLTTVAASVVLVSLAPVWVALLGPRLTGEPVPRGAWLGVVLAVLGCAVIGFGDLRIDGRALVGDLLALVGGLAGALYLLVGKTLRSGWPIQRYVLAVYGSAALCLVPVAAFAGAGAFELSPASIGWIVALALVPQLIGHSSYNWALAHASTTLVAVAMLGEPIVAPLLAWGILGEVPTGLTVAGAALVFAGLVVTTRAERRGRAIDEKPEGE